MKQIWDPGSGIRGSGIRGIRTPWDPGSGLRFFGIRDPRDPGSGHETGLFIGIRDPGFLGSGPCLFWDPGSEIRDPGHETGK